MVTIVFPPQWQFSKLWDENSTNHELCLRFAHRCVLLWFDMSVSYPFPSELLYWRCAVHRKDISWCITKIILSQCTAVGQISRNIIYHLWYDSANAWTHYGLGTWMNWIIVGSMMTSSNGNIFRVTGHLCGKFTGPRWISRTKASDAELWCSFDMRPNIRLSKQSWGWWFETPPQSLWRHRNVQVFTCRRSAPNHYINRNCRIIDCNLGKNWIKTHLFSAPKIHLKYRLQNTGHFVQASSCYVLLHQSWKKRYHI